MKKSFIIETERLGLREWKLADAQALFNLHNDDEVLKYTGDEPFASIIEAKHFIQLYPDFRTQGMGRWGIIEKNTSAFIGWCGLKFVPAFNEIDLGYRLIKTHWNKGYATEAAKACLHYGFTDLQLNRIIARTMKANSASIKVLQKCGLVFEKEIEFEEHEGLCFGATRWDWLNKHAF